GRTWDAIVELKADGASIEGFVIDGFGRGGFCSGRSFTGIMMHGGLGMAAIGNTGTGIRDEPFSGGQAGIGIGMDADAVGDPRPGRRSIRTRSSTTRSASMSGSRRTRPSRATTYG